ncbi:hypothetical protein B0H13DRAFT_2360235 [Mycena leptocephala]|nr:hypothetical protein B0H13DRAFT_2360235 [Mycena leptocephala]
MLTLVTRKAPLSESCRKLSIKIPKTATLERLRNELAKYWFTQASSRLTVTSHTHATSAPSHQHPDDTLNFYPPAEPLHFALPRGILPTLSSTARGEFRGTVPLFHVATDASRRSRSSQGIPSSVHRSGKLTQDQRQAANEVAPPQSRPRPSASATSGPSRSSNSDASIAGPSRSASSPSPPPAPLRRPSRARIQRIASSDEDEEHEEEEDGDADELIKQYGVEGANAEELLGYDDEDDEGEGDDDDEEVVSGAQKPFPNQKVSGTAETVPETKGSGMVSFLQFPKPFDSGTVSVLLKPKKRYRGSRNCGFSGVSVLASILVAFIFLFLYRSFSSMPSLSTARAFNAAFSLSSTLVHSCCDIRQRDIRHRAGHDRVTEPPPSPSSRPSGPGVIHEFIECDMTLMSNIHRVETELRARIPKINFLILTPGDLLPAVEAAKGESEDGKVMSVLAAGWGGKIDLKDLGLKKSFSVASARAATLTYCIIQCAPHTRGEHLPHPVFTPFIYSAQSTGEHHLYAFLMAGSGAVRTGPKGDDIGLTKEYSGSKEAMGMLWAHTEEATKT